MTEAVSLRETYGKTLAMLGKDNPDIVVLDADLRKSTMTHFFSREFPERSFDCGIAEQNMISMAAGLAVSGKIAFASTFAVFLPGRCFDQVRMSVAQPHLNVKIVATHGGITVGEDGSSHQSIEDLALACALPGFSVIVPADAIETEQVIRTAAATKGPFYIRICRPAIPLLFDDTYRFELGKAVLMRQGTQVTIIAIGLLVTAAVEAADNLQKEGIDCRVLNMSTLKPADQNVIISAAKDTGAIVTAEEHLHHGGLGSTVASIVTGNCPVPVEFVDLKDRYAESGKPFELMGRYGLTASEIEKAVKKVISRK